MCMENNQLSFIIKKRKKEVHSRLMRLAKKSFPQKSVDWVGNEYEYQYVKTDFIDHDYSREQRTVVRKEECVV